MTFIDTNYFLRFLLKDNDSQHETAKQLFRDGAEGKVSLTTSLLVLFEVYWVLSSFYEKQKKELGDLLEKILAMEFIECEGRRDLQKALEIFSHENVDLEDAYNLAFAKRIGVQDFRTFDKKLALLFRDSSP